MQPLDPAFPIERQLSVSASAVVLVNSAEAFQQAMRAMQEARLGLAPEGVSFSPALYRVIRE